MSKKNNEPTARPYDSSGRPQIIVIGNGLERMDDKGGCTPGSLKNAGKNWNDLVNTLTVPDRIEL